MYKFNLSYVEQQGLIDALELYVASESIARNGLYVGDDKNYLSTKRTKELIDMLVGDLNEAVTTTIESGRRDSFIPITITYPGVSN